MHLIVGFLLATLLAFSATANSAESEIDHLAQILELRPGSSMADVGAGSGEVSLALAKFVEPNGTVYATEIDPKLLDKIRRASQKANATDVRVVAGTDHDTGLLSNSCDAIFLREVYHHLTDPAAMDRSLYRAMRPGGRLAIIDFEPSQRPGEPVPPGVPANRGGHGAPMKIVEAELTEVGFKFVRTVDWPISATIHHYCMLFRKP
jgi:ubiquinone/menaquinone biosynthesis C-methylase UbiE